MNNWDPRKESWRKFCQRSAREGFSISRNDEPTWCPDCGRMMPWKHSCWPTLKARIANRALRFLSRVEDLVRNWRDAEEMGTNEYMRRNGASLR